MIKIIIKSSLIMAVLLGIWSPNLISGNQNTLLAQGAGNGKEGALPPSKVKPDCDTEQLTSSNCRVLAYFVQFINILGGLVGITVVGVIAFAGIEYSSSRDNPQRVAAARQRITNAMIALVSYMIMMAFLQWIVPGGIFR